MICPTVCRFLHAFLEFGNGHGVVDPVFLSTQLPLLIRSYHGGNDLDRGRVHIVDVDKGILLLT